MELTDTKKVDRMKWLNEIQHRVISKITNERLSLKEWTEEDFIRMVCQYIEKCPAIAGEISWIINHAYEYVNGE